MVTALQTGASGVRSFGSYPFGSGGGTKLAHWHNGVILFRMTIENWSCGRVARGVIAEGIFVPENLALILMETLPGRCTTRGIQPDVYFKGGREESCSALPGK